MDQSFPALEGKDLSEIAPGLKRAVDDLAAAGVPAAKILGYVKDNNRLKATSYGPIVLAAVEKYLATITPKEL